MKKRSFCRGGNEEVKEKGGNYGEFEDVRKEGLVGIKKGSMGEKGKVREGRGREVGGRYLLVCVKFGGSFGKVCAA